MDRIVLRITGQIAIYEKTRLFKTFDKTYCFCNPIAFLSGVIVFLPRQIIQSGAAEKRYPISETLLVSTTYHIDYILIRSLCKSHSNELKQKSFCFIH